MHVAGNLFRAGRYREAASLFHSLASSGDLFIAARATGNLGGCRFALHQYQPALASFLEARRLAARGGDLSAVAGLDVNIASLYTEMGDLEAAARWIEGTRERLSDAADRRAHLPALLIQLATIRARQRTPAAAFGLFREAIHAADQAGDLNLYALGWNRWGEELLKSHDRAGAEPALLEAYRVRKLNHLPLDSSYRNLGRLRLEQGDLRSASNLLDRAVELSATNQGQVPTWDLYHYRGRVRLSQGRLREALDDLRTAVRLGRAWRWSAASSDAGRPGDGHWLSDVHGALIEAGNRLYLQTGDRALARETLAIWEEDRSSSLRQLHTGPAANLPPGYWEALLRLQRAEVQVLRGGSRNEVSAARVELARMEDPMAPRALPAHADLLDRAQAALPEDGALLSFYVSDTASWMWAVDRDGFEVYPLPPRPEIDRQVQNAVQAIREDRDFAGVGSGALYHTLFGPLAARFSQRRHWVLALDDSLFDAPIPALAASSGRRPTLLVELHSTQVIPGVGWWLDAAGHPSRPAASLFVGVGDPVYNAADVRLPSGALPALALPRLVASGPELDACARAWEGEHELLKGPAASRRNLQEQLQRNPAVVHFATHVVESPSGAGGRIALSRATGGDIQLLAPEEIAGWRIDVGLIVLSGCRSAVGQVVAGAGLLGLTRAWLAAGASDVIGSRWSTPDDTGVLFDSLYRHLRTEKAGPSQALRDARLDMLRAGGWRARPRYWSAYFVVGIEGRK